MKMSDERVNGWEQLSLYHPRVTEMTLRVGLMPDDDHAQFELEIRDPSSDTLLGLWSRPHVPWSEVYRELEHWQEMVTLGVEQADEPFPDRSREL